MEPADREAHRVDGPPVVVATVSSRGEGELVAGFLRSHGLGAAVVTDDAGGQEPQLQLQSSGVRVLVRAADEASARQLLADAGTTERHSPTT
jgi:hypothetical protein